MGSMPDDRKTLGQVLSTSSSSSSSPFSTPAFTSNGTLGRVLTFEVPKGPMLRRRPGICSERYEREKAEFEKIPLYERMWIGLGRDARLEPTDALQSAKTFQRACEQMPDEIPKSALDEKLQQLNDHYSGKNPLPPEQSLELRRRTSFLQDVYTPGPRWENSVSGAESAWLSEQNLRFGNSLGIALLGPLFGAPGAATRVLGGSEQQVAAANQVGAAAFDMAAAHVGLGGKKSAGEPLPRAGESSRGSPLEPVSRPVGGKTSTQNPPLETPTQGTVVRRLPPSVPPPRPKVQYDKKQLQAKYKHAKDFGVNDPWGKNAAGNYQSALEAHVQDPGTQMINGTYRGDSVIHYLNPSTGLNVMTDTSHNFLSGWRLNPAQINNVQTRGSL
ncbi:colicin D domain-containing protein [Variovorax sp. CAN2819]|uniref:colicin D domain-containing protein n=1 Tax=Variovorax sp. CAN15 TaxID=3046727 RepID=UPI0026471710|nr:colicin D domain-containing protein [Variovorax sp. CAN15]MDN6884811.1 colicin D domain-containing protein [Variovorax sp. CAN15]